MIAFVALHIYLDRAGTVAGAQPNPNFANSRSRCGCACCLAAPAGICATLERATVAKMVLQNIRNIRSRRRKSRCLQTREGGGKHRVRPSPQRQPGPTEHGDLVRPVAGSWLRGWRAGQPQRLGRCRSAPRAARRPRGCCASLEPAERYVERSHRRRLEKTAFEFKSGARRGASTPLKLAVHYCLSCGLKSLSALHSSGAEL